MAVPSTQTMELGAQAPHFSLLEVTSGQTVTLEDVAVGSALVVAFICRHCPFVIHVQDAFAALAKEYGQRGVAVVGISANDPELSPADAPEGLAEQKSEVGFEFPYLFDADQSVAKAYHAACTPDFFVFDGDRKLLYRGQMDSSRPDSGVEATGEDLREALDRALEGASPLSTQNPSIGCSIKWSDS